jgi:hypothetical protein
VAGWDLNKADGLRKLTKLKGKNPKLALQLEVEFIEGTMKKHGTTYEEAKEVWDKVVLPFAGYGFNKTMHKDTLVYTTSGSKKMSQCRPGDKVFSLASNNEIEISNIVEVHDHGIVPLWKVEFDDGCFEECTLGHKWATSGRRTSLIEVLADESKIDSISLSRLPQSVSIKKTDESAQKEVYDIQKKCKKRRASYKREKNVLQENVCLYKSRIIKPLSKLSKMSRYIHYGKENVRKTRYTTSTSGKIGKMASGQSRKICRNKGQGARFSKKIKNGILFGKIYKKDGFCKKQDNFVRKNTKTNRFYKSRFENCNRGGRSLAFFANTGTKIFGKSAAKRLYSRERSVKEELDTSTNFNGYVQKRRRNTSICVGQITKYNKKQECRNILHRKVVRISFSGFKRGLDIEVDHPSHNFLLTSGLFTSNSHAVFYSINGYITAYLKCHYPAAFLAAYLKIKTNRGGINKDEEIAMARNECRRIGIKIVPPDINKSGAGYEVLDESTIVMGFSAIKGMGVKAIEETVAKQPFENITDFLYRVKARVVNKAKLDVLAKAGCFDSMNVSRKAFSEESKKVRDKMNAFLRKKLKDGYESEMALEEFPVSFSTDEWPKQEVLRHEQEVLGEIVSGNLGDLFPGFFTGISATPFSRLKFLPNRHNIVVEFLVKSLLREFKIKTGKYTGQMMIKYRVEDVYGIETDLTVWPSEYKNAKRVMKEGKPIRAQCQVSDFNGEKTIMLRSIEKTYGM